MRGKLRMAGVDVSIARITPACAGKTGKITIRVLTIGDHPRVCGENVQGQ